MSGEYREQVSGSDLSSVQCSVPHYSLPYEAWQVQSLLAPFSLPRQMIGRILGVPTPDGSYTFEWGKGYLSPDPSMTRMPLDDSYAS